MARTVVVSTALGAPVDAVWASARTMAGVNAELRPLARMTVPRRMRGRRIDELPTGERAFTSVVLAFGVLPFDLHFLAIAEQREHGFLERSSSLVQRSWEHERSIAAEDGGCRVTDRVTFAPRLPGGEAVAAPLVERVFRHRHARLAARFGAR